MPEEKKLEFNHPLYAHIFVTLAFALVLLCIIPYTKLVDYKRVDDLRAQIINVHENFRYFVLRDHLFTQVYVTGNNWMVYLGEESLDDYQNTIEMDDEQTAGVCRKLQAIQDRLEAKGIRFLMVVPPNKNTIYPEYMPDEIPVLGEHSLLDRIMTCSTTQGSVHILDLRALFLEHKDSQQMYYPKDTHWTPFAAQLTYQQILKTLQPDFPQLVPHPYDEYNIVFTPAISDLPGLAKVTVVEDYYQLELKTPATQPVDVQINPEGTLLTFSQNAPNLPKLVMVRDSFADWLIPMLYEHFQKGVVISTKSIDEAFIDEEKPDIVLFEMTERYLFTLLDLP